MRTIAAASVTTLLLAFSGRAYGDAASPEKYQTFKGTVVKVNDKERTMTARGFWLCSTKTFNVGENCKVLIGDKKKEATLKDLAPGNRVEVHYTSVGGVNVASQIAERYRHYTGHIVAIDPSGQNLTIKRGTYEKPFVLASDCHVLLNDKEGAMNDLKVGHKVTVAYASEGDRNLAHKIAQSSLSFVGTLEAIDSDTRTLKAEHVFTDRKFHLADDCPIVINGQAGGRLSDLRIGDQVMFSYENVDGVLVANRVARETEPAKSETSQAVENAATYSVK
jgi:Cu/Ag efflux protein CusF